MKKYILIILILLPIFCNAQKLDFKLEQPDTLFIGSPFHLMVDIISGKDDSIFVPIIDTLDVFILKENPKPTVSVKNDSVLTTFDYIFQPFNTGKYTLPQLEFTVKSNDSLVVLKTDEVELTINSVVPDSVQAIVDIAGPLSINFSFWDIFIPIIIIAALIILIINIIKLLKRPKYSVAAEEIIDNRPPYQIALEMLDNLQKRELLKIGDFLSFHFHLSYILRFFIERQYQLNAVEMTTSEIRDNLKLTDFTEKSKILEFLNFADKVKFAKFIPKLEESRNAESWLEQYLNSFKQNTTESREVDNA